MRTVTPIFATSIMFFVSSSARADEQITPSNLRLTTKIGVGIFQDIQVPENQATQTRGDGTPIGAEGESHRGLPLEVGLMLNQKLLSHFSLSESFSALMMQSPEGTTGGSSYVRLEGAAHVSGKLTPWLALRAGLLARQSVFNNLSSSHFVRSVLPNAQVSGYFGDYKASVAIARSAFAKFGVTQDYAWNGYVFKESTTDVTSFDTSLSHLLDRDVALTWSFNREIITTKISDISEYNSFGLSVLDPARPSRAYQLTTDTISIGLVKAL